ncbi:glucuronate isomerase [Alginatibacterium sediminis]|uniref:Uronate isomerase n=1 Tax=Alginatibacterium sediminis TaxID=2164068 RepID=A0A420EB20_9ALTE|nr:glucuronate isomerase [Alginatibacterium sediminis]RKF17887.1 glucuronate isomerase [Alginatibacterium sediminis]
MTPFINSNFLLQGETARGLYHNIACQLPIIDYHNHLDAKAIFENQKYQSITEAWLSSDHYFWRALRSNGVEERYITGDASDYKKFQMWCETMPYLLGNPLYHWCHLELKTYFDLDLVIKPENCDAIWEHCNRLLQLDSHSIQQLLLSSKVDTLCTTDDPLSDLAYHRKLSVSDFKVQVLPTFRADSLFDIENAVGFNQVLRQLEQVTEIPITDFESYAQAMLSRVQYFADTGCCLSDLGLKIVDFALCLPKRLDYIMAKIQSFELLTQLEIAQFKTAVFRVLGKAYHKYGWSMQIHVGVLTNVNVRRLNSLGSGAGFSVINDKTIANNLSLLLSMLDEKRQLPQTILYSVNPKDSVVLGSILGAFQDSDCSPGKIQLGSAWWFNDHKSGMEQQLQDLANLGCLGRFIGMLTDSRSVLSFSRHEYFRRILCNFIGEWADKGEIPNDADLLTQLVENICYLNAKRYFKFSHSHHKI